MRRPGISSTLCCFEPGHTAWKAAVIPLDHRRTDLVFYVYL